MHISDAAMCERRSLVAGRIFLYTQKTGTPVYIPIPPFLVQRLTALPFGSKYFFVPKDSTRMETVANYWRKRLKVAFTAAGIERGHPHQFRDTFAVGKKLWNAR